jgi:multiple sugar transport system ATP-binding protein
MSTIELRSLTKRFHRLVAVGDVDLTVGAGEVVCLLGPSGCGKTTTLRMIAGLEAPTSGDVLIAGKRVNDLRTRDRNIAMVFQFYALYPTQTVAENLAYPLHVDRLPPAEFAKRVDRVSAALQLGHILDRVPGQLSEGEKQRVAVGRAIIRDPTCFLFDEPLSRLDVQLRETMRGQIKEILTGLNKATVIVTHDQLEALTMADRIAVMRGGVIEQSATPHDIFNKPTNLFVASFIGTPQMNLIPATLLGPDGSGGTWRFKIGDQTATIATDPAVGRLAAGAAVTLGIRPRNIDLVAAGAEDGLAATVDLIEPMGAETLLHLVEGGQDLRVVADARLERRVGDKLRLRFRPGQTHVFDQSDQRVAS